MQVVPRIEWNQIKWTQGLGRAKQVMIAIAHGVFLKKTNNKWARSIAAGCRLQACQVKPRAR
jgi:hypothetical protein